jgi:hypothetical protein
MIAIVNVSTKSPTIKASGPGGCGLPVAKSSGAASIVRR